MTKAKSPKDLKVMHHTLESVGVAARQYATRNAFKHGDPKAYGAACRLKVLDLVCKHMARAKSNYTRQDVLDAAGKYQSVAQMDAAQPKLYAYACRHNLRHLLNIPAPTPVTLAEAKACAAQYLTRTEFARRAPNEYKICGEAGVMDEACAHMRILRAKDWNYESCLQAAQNAGSRMRFQKQFGGAYCCARKNNWLNTPDFEKALARKRVKKGTWQNIELLAQEARKYKTRVAFEEGNIGAYSSAVKYGLLENEIIFGHMEEGSVSDKDVIYIWEAVNESYNGKRVFKIGVTSSRLGEQRIQEVAKKAGMEVRIILMRWLGRWYVPDLERYLLTFGENPKLDIKDGRTEFRALTEEELQVIIKIIESHPIL